MTRVYRSRGGFINTLFISLKRVFIQFMKSAVQWDQSPIFTRPILANLILTLLLRSWLNVYMQNISCFIGAGCNADLTATKYCQPVLSLLNSKLATKHLCESQENFSTQNRWRIFKLKGFSSACSCIVLSSSRLPVIIVTIVIIIMTIVDVIAITILIKFDLRPLPIPCCRLFLPPSLNQSVRWQWSQAEMKWHWQRRWHRRR